VEPLDCYQNERRQGESRTENQIHTANVDAFAALPQWCC